MSSRGFVDAVAIEILRHAQTVAGNARHLAHRARTPGPGPDGFPSGGDSVRAHGVADPTLATVESLAGGGTHGADTWPPRPDPVADRWARAWTAMRAALEELRVAAGAMVDPSTGQPARSAGLAKCANAHGCPEDRWADPGRSGRCEACWRFRHRNGRDRRVVTSP